MAKAKGFKSFSGVSMSGSTTNVGNWSNVPGVVSYKGLFDSASRGYKQGQELYKDAYKKAAKAAQKNKQPDYASAKGKYENVDPRLWPKKDIIDAEVVDEGPRTPKGAIDQEIIDAEIIEPKKEISRGQQFGAIGNKPRLAIEGPKQSRGWLAGGEISLDELKSGRFAGTIYSGKTVDKAEGRPAVKPSQRPSTRASKDPVYRQNLLSDLSKEAPNPNRGQQFGSGVSGSSF